MEQKQRLLLFPILTAAAIAGAIFFNAKADIAGNIVVVSDIDTLSSTAYLNVTMLERAPPMSELVAGRYDAVVVFDDQGGFDIQTIKSDDFKQILSAIISDPFADHTGAAGLRGKGTNIIGFILIKVLPQKAYLSMSDSLEKGLDISTWSYNGLYIAALIAVFILIAVVKTRKDYVRS